MTSGYYTTTQSETFTVTHARHIAAKVATDLKRMQRFYERPDDREIDTYEKEVVALLRGDYLDAVTYGFHRAGTWVVALKYAARQGGVVVVDASPGNVPMGADVRDCAFGSFFAGNSQWRTLTEEKKRQVYANAGLPYFRVLGDDYDASNQWHADKVYSAGGRGVLRHVIA